MYFSFIIYILYISEVDLPFKREFYLENNFHQDYTCYLILYFHDT